MTLRMRFPLMTAAAAIAAALLAPAAARAATITWDGGGSDTLWTTGANWSDDLAPAAGNDYVVASATVRSPDDGGAEGTQTNTFAGDSLTLNNSTLELYRNIGGSTGRVQHDAIANLTLNNSTLSAWENFATGATTLLDGAAFSGDSTIRVGTQGGTYSYTLTLSGAITGSGTLDIFRTAQGSGRTLNFDSSADTSAYAGDVTFHNTGSNETLSVNFNNTTAWGTGNLTVGDYANVKLSAVTLDRSTSNVVVTNNGAVNLNGSAATVHALTIAGNAVASGTYTSADLTALGYGGTFTGAGTLTISHAATVYAVADGSWAAPSTWDDNADPAPGINYVVNGYTVSAPDDGGSEGTQSNTFAGGSLTIDGGTLKLYRNIGGNTGRTQTDTIADLTLNNAVVDAYENFATGATTLDGAITLTGDNTLKVGASGGTYSYTLTVAASLAGDGSLDVVRTGQGSGRTLNISGDTSAYSGAIIFENIGSTETLSVSLDNTTGWGTGDLTLGDYAALTFSSTDLTRLLSHLIIADTASLNLNGSNDTIASLTINGNAVAAGTYTSADLAALGYGGTFTGAGTLTIPGVTSIPTPAALPAGLALLGLTLTRRRRKGS